MEPVVIIEAAHLVVYASIPKAPNHSGNRAQEEQMGDALADGYPTVAAWQYSEFP